jgi:tetratricopeptide (TPR) repeat protein
MNHVALPSIHIRSIAWTLVLASLTAFSGWHLSYSVALADARRAYGGQGDPTPTSNWLTQITDLVSGAKSQAQRHRSRSGASPSIAQPDYHLALRRALDHLRRHPNDPEGTRFVALCLSRLDYAAEAEPYYALAQAKTRLSPQDLHVRAFGFSRCNLRAQAVEAYKQILDRQPDDPEALQKLAAIYYSLSQYKEALATAQRLAQSPIKSRAVAGYALIGIVHHDEHRPGLAVAANEKALELDPQLELLSLPADLFFADLAQDLVDINRASDAQRYIHRILGQRDDPVLIDILGSAYYAEGQEDEAERCWKRVIDLDPRFHRPWLNLGKLALRRGRLEEAVPYLEKAHALDRRIHEPAYQLSLAYRRLGRAEDSERYRKLAESLRLNNPNNKRGMGLIPSDKP